ncbi:MAG: hypothetical protein H6601_10800 [Flavobacteriales bacterium]|nr:hypothetical protein [Flavobacteriales bacterium]
MNNICVFGILIITLFSASIGEAQILSPERITAWENAGPTTELVAPTNQVDITDFGADNTGVNSCNTALADALTDLNGAAGTIFFPAGEYFFDAGISLPDSVFLKGESNTTQLTFNLGGNNHCIQVNGSISSAQVAITEPAIKGTYRIVLEDASSFVVGDYIRTVMFDEDHMYSTWAYGTLGQVIEITAIDGDTLSLADPLTHHYPLSRTPYVKKVTPKKGVGIECLKIVREDATAGQMNNILMTYATNCVIRNVEGVDCNYGHVDLITSSHILVEACYFHHAHAYGGGGQGYGIMVEASSCFNLVHNNIFEHLRHSMILQSAANANVFGYNYSYDPYWEDGFLPANSAGDAVLHGNYTYLNLFEGNTVQHMVVDASHGSNGPYNTYFRNRGELYGFFSDSETPTDSLNVIGNEITGSSFPYGLFMLNGNGYYSFGNNHSGTVTPSGTENMTLNTLYLDENSLPTYFFAEQLPMVGYPLAMNEKKLYAEMRFDNQTYVSCSELVASMPTNEQNELLGFANGQLMIDAALIPATVHYLDMNGRLVYADQVNSTRMQMPDLSNGIYIVQVVGRKEIHNIKVLIAP